MNYILGKNGEVIMFEKECVPFAPSLIESMRSLGYSFPTAIADLIDNSISANATNIEIITEPSRNPQLILIDDGCGMDDEKLQEAMRYGSKNPLELRKEDDLGRFGIGLKSASLSQCRKLIVISKYNNIIVGYSWDLDYVIEKGSWMLKGFEPEEIAHFPYIDRLYKSESGTYILLQEFDRIKESTSDIQTTFNKYMDDTINHLGLVFHRFLNDSLKIYVNEARIIPQDPFLTSHKGTQIKRETSFYINEEKITLKPFILPHLSKLKQADLDKVGGKEKLRSEQGFYVYRNKRLIIWGTWFRLERKDELNKLARVMVDIPNSLDYMWSIDIKKSTATLPDIIKKNMYSAVYESVISSEAVHAYRGRRSIAKEEVDYIWERIESRVGYEYKINRNIPQIKLLKESLNIEQIGLLEQVVKEIEESIPVSTLYVDVAKGNVEAKKNKEIEELWKDLALQIEYVRKNKLQLKNYCMAFMRVEPYSRFEEIKKRLTEEMKLDE